MNAVLDEKCPGLANIPQFLDELKAASGSEPVADEPELAPHQPAPPELIARLEQLKLEREQLKVAIETQNQLKDAGANQAALVKTLNSLGDGDIDRETAHMIRTQWYDQARDAALRRVAEYLEQYRWPKEDPPALQKASPTSDPALAQALAQALQLDKPAVFAALAKPIGDRAVFHFSTSTDTAQSDKPEWLFTYLFKVLELRAPWLSTQLQLLTAAPLEALVSALIPALAHCCRTYTKDEHFVQQVLQCAATLEHAFWVSEATADSLVSRLIGGSNRIRQFIGDQSGVYSAALASVVDDTAPEIDFDADAPSAKPTFAALHVKQLFADADAILRLDPPRVLRACHLRILDEYHAHLERVTAEFYPLCCAFGSAAYFKGVLDRWSVQLAVASVDAAEIDACVARYSELRGSIAGRLAKILLRSAQKSLKPYFLLDWRECDESSTELRQFFDALRPDMELVQRLVASSRADRARITVPFAEKLAELIYRLVVEANVFSLQSASLLRADVERIWSEWQLPRTARYCQLADAVRILATGEHASAHLSPENVQGLMRRRR